MSTYTLTTEWLESFCVRQTGGNPTLVCVHCMHDIGPEDSDGDIQEGIDLEQLVRWSVDHTCPDDAPKLI